jgi:hypothetical protein
VNDFFGDFCIPATRTGSATDHARELRRRARLTTARLARDREDLGFLLQVLGLLPSQDPGTR